MNNIVKGILLSTALIGVGTGGYFAYKKISDQNTMIKSLEVEIETLEKENQTLKDKISNLNSVIDTLENSTGYEYITTSECVDYIYSDSGVYSSRFFSRVDKVLSVEYILSYKGYVPNNSDYSSCHYSDWSWTTSSGLKNFINNFSVIKSFYNSKYEVYKYTLKDSWGYVTYNLTYSNYFRYESSECKFRFYYNNKEYSLLDFPLDEISSLSLAKYCIVNDKTISFYFLDLEVFSGKYMGSNGSFINFDNKTAKISDWSFDYSSYYITESTGIYMKFVCDYETQKVLFKLDSSTGNLIINGETYTKVTDDTSET